MEATSVLAVLLAGLLAGSELTSRFIVHPTLWKLDHREQVRAEKLVYRRFASIDPFLMTGTVVACFVAASQLDGDSAVLAGGRRCLLRRDARNHPPGEHADQCARVALGRGEGRPARVAAIRRRWDRFHTVRVVLDSAGFLLVALAVVG